MKPHEEKDEPTFKFQRNIFATTSTGSQHCRVRLQERFERDADSSSSDRSVLSVLSLNDPRKVLRSGAEKISRTFSSVRTSLGNFSQRFKASTRRRQILEEGPVTPNCATPQSRLVLGRTPTKLYSPFGIESPKANGDCDKENQAPPTKDRWPRYN